ncbi:hypothetical protein GCM10025772_21570 [Ferrimonas gelatinilytica]|uniref:Cytochrome B n=1 Tax=Ferrimonas gelatinilytica TaxID=1255257 RepID=A0ABP9S9Y6_9GAMM
MPVWDEVLRLTHWAVVLLLGLCWFSAEQGEMAWHQTFAYLLLAVLLTRLSWGLYRSGTARLRTLF